MTQISHACAVFLLIAFAASSLVYGVGIAPTQSRPAPCHGDAPFRPRPVSHDCCTASHQAAQPTMAFSIRPEAAAGGMVVEFPIVDVVVSVLSPEASSSPPALIPLRI